MLGCSTCAGAAGAGVTTGAGATGVMGAAGVNGAGAAGGLLFSISDMFEFSFLWLWSVEVDDAVCAVTYVQTLERVQSTPPVMMPIGSIRRVDVLCVVWEKGLKPT